MNNVDHLLSLPLKKVKDDQFSVQVLKRINHYYRWRSLVLKSLSLALFLLFIAVSSPVLLLAKLYTLSEFFALKFTYLSQVDINTVLSQITQQPILALVFILSLIMIFGLQEN